MRVETVRIQPYRLALRRPWVSARGPMAAREGWLVAVASDGIWGYGDCAPLPEAGTEDAATAWRCLCAGQEGLCALPLAGALGSARTAARAAPAAACALECALLDLQSRLLGLPLRCLLAPEAADRIAVNGALGSLAGIRAADLERASAAGLRVLKIKVGIADPGWELGRLHELATPLPPGLGLRLDANGAWDPDTAARMLAGLAGLPVESLEEPLAVPDPRALARLQSRAGFPLALDESLPSRADGLDPARFPVRRAVLKPAALGGLVRTLDLARRLQGAGVETVVTSLVESAAGLWATAQLAAAVASPHPHGLDTAAWLLHDLGTPPVPRRGGLDLPDRPGSGFAPAARPIPATRGLGNTSR